MACYMPPLLIIVLWLKNNTYPRSCFTGSPFNVNECSWEAPSSMWEYGLVSQEIQGNERHPGHAHIGQSTSYVHVALTAASQNVNVNWYYTMIKYRQRGR